MFPRLLALCLLVPPLLFPVAAFADEERAPAPVVISGKYGSCYARSTPRPLAADDTEIDVRSHGTTEVYRVGVDQDERLDSYDWFAQQLFVACFEVPEGVAVARLGPWARGGGPTNKALAIAFYLNGKEVRSYTTDDIYDLTEEYIRTISHYMVFSLDAAPQFRWDHVSNAFVFEIKDARGKPITFSPVTGEILSYDGKPI